MAELNRKHIRIGSKSLRRVLVDPLTAPCNQRAACSFIHRVEYRMRWQSIHAIHARSIMLPASVSC